MNRGGLASHAQAKKLVLKRESTFGEDTVKSVEMTAKDIGESINFVDKAEPGFERIDPNFERNAAVGKMLSNGNTCYREVLHGWKSQSMW